MSVIEMDLDDGYMVRVDVMPANSDVTIKCVSHGEVKAHVTHNHNAFCPQCVGEQMQAQKLELGIVCHTDKKPPLH